MGDCKNVRMEKYFRKVIAGVVAISCVVLKGVRGVWIGERIVNNRYVTSKSDVLGAKEWEWIQKATGSVVVIVIISSVVVSGTVARHNVILCGNGHGEINPRNILNVVVTVSRGEIGVECSISSIDSVGVVRSTGSVGVVVGPRSVLYISAIGNDGEINIVNTLLVALLTVCVVIGNV